jgi:membrane protease YdiL (CAAX protease family)
MENPTHMLEKIPRTLKREALAYVVIACALSWAMWIAAIKLQWREAFLNYGTCGPALAAMVLCYRHQTDFSASRTVRIAWFVGLLPVCWAALSLHYLWRSADGLPLHLDPLLIGPALLPAWIISGAFSRDLGVRALLRQLVHTPNRWSLFALLSFPAFLLIPAAVVHLLRGHLVNPSGTATISARVARASIFFAYNLFFVAVLEEPGWRGFLLDRLQSKFSPIVATILVWLPWALWHWPLDCYRPVRFTLTVWILLRVVFMIPLAIILTWFYRRSGRSIQATALFHAGMNTFPFVLPYSQPAFGLIFVWAAYAVISDRMWRRDMNSATHRQHYGKPDLDG